MRKQLSIFFLVLVISVGWSNLYASRMSCELILSGNHSQNSSMYSLDMDNLGDRDWGRDYLGLAFHSIRHLLQQQGCERSDINFGKGPFGQAKSKCLYLVRDHQASHVCYVESNIGYFFLTWDMLTGINIVYNRWD
ncbi:MAG: hypothetical protein HN353_04445 [Bdellovibrionales bacterium]|nr:hypothetical protein [Bdellovibrionales bacterium]MBT3527465.1 hypothetical protein [Bdellovibrionales bacterium]MBT7670636.1 hypothetical protein [Bdellovibrionales bacterium]